MPGHLAYTALCTSRTGNNFMCQRNLRILLAPQQRFWSLSSSCVLFLQAVRDPGTEDDMPCVVTRTLKQARGNATPTTKVSALDCTGTEYAVR